jgi:hypothetical protein
MYNFVSDMRIMTNKQVSVPNTPADDLTRLPPHKMGTNKMYDVVPDPPELMFLTTDTIRKHYSVYSIMMLLLQLYSVALMVTLVHPFSQVEHIRQVLPSRIVCHTNVVNGKLTVKWHHQQRCSGQVNTQKNPSDINIVEAPKNPVSDCSPIDIKKEGVKIFGRLAEKYIALDSSGGNCCYSGCTGCEYRLPGGGYIMADQSSSRPKWIPHYESCNTNQREHVTKWYTQLYLNNNVTVITKDDFVNHIMKLEYTPPLGGPYISASAAQITDVTLLQYIFETLAENTTKLTKYKMSIRIKQLSDGEEGMTWQSFERMIESINRI